MIKQLVLVSHEAMIRTKMGGGGDHITKHGAWWGGPISPIIWASPTREMGPGGGGEGGISLLHDIANLIVVAIARQLYTY